MIDVHGVTPTIMVSDLDRSQAFYTGHFGYSVAYRAGPHFCMLEKDGSLLGLHPGGEPAPQGRSGDLSIGFGVSDIREAVDALEANGVEFPGGIVDDDGAILRADFTDPDGTRLYLVQQRR